MEDPEFRRLLSAELPRLYRLAHRLAPPGVDPEDLTQDVLERAWRNRTSYREEARISTWLHRIMVNRTGDLVRRLGARPVSDDSCDLDECAVEIADPSVVIERASEAAALRAALSQLSPADRTVLVLRDGEDWRAEEVAQTIGVSTEAVHKRLQRGRLRLAAELSRTPAGELSGGTPDSCRAARTRVSGYLENRLEPEVRAEVDRHLRDCVRCPPVVQATVGLRDAMLERPSVRVPESLTRALEATVDAAP